MERPAAGRRRDALLKTLLVRLAQVAATVLVTWFVVRSAGLGLAELQELDLDAWTPRWLVLAGSCVVLLAGYFTTGYLWGRIVADLGGPRLPVLASIRIFMIANLGRYVPGKVWQIAGLAVLAKSRGVAAANATAAAAVGQGIALAAAALLGLGSAWVFLEGSAWRWIVPVALVLSVGAGLLPPVFRAASDLWFRLARAPAPESPRSSSAVVWLAVGLGSWILYALSFWVFVRGLGLQAPAAPTASAFAAAYVLGYVMVFAPAGIGVREGFLVVFLSPQLGPGPAGAVAVMARVWTTLVEVVPAFAFWVRPMVSPGGGSAARE